MEETDNIPKRRRGRPRKSSSQNKILAEQQSNYDDETFDVAASAVKALQAVETVDGDPDFMENMIESDGDNDDDENFQDNGPASEEDENMPIEVDDDNESLVEKKPKRKVRKIKTETPKRLKRVTKVKTTVNKNRIIRGLKDLSAAKDKINRIYGSNETRLLELAKVKEGFEAYLFDFPEKLLQNTSEYYIPKITPSGQRNIYDQLHNKLIENQRSSISRKEETAKFKLRSEPLEVLIGDIQTSLKTSEKVEFPVFSNYERKGFVYNVGGMITDIAWLSQDDETDQYLAVAVSQYLDKPSHAELRNFDAVSHVSSIQIFKMNPDTFGFEKIQTILHDSGEIWNLKWHDGYKSENSLGLLFFVCQDGCLKYIEISKKKSEKENVILYEDIITSISIPNNRITCFDFLSSSTVLCGFRDGNIAEFDILADSTIPSFYQKVHDTYVLNIAVAYSDYEKTAVATNSVDGTIFVFDLQDIKATKTTLDQRFRGSNTAPLVYSPLLYSLVYSDGSNSVKAAIPRALFGTHQLGPTNATVNTISTSKYHPFNLCGGSDGSVYIENLVRRLLTGIKNISETHRNLKLWKWDYDQVNKYFRLDHNYEVFKCTSTGSSKIAIDVHGINVTSIKWNENEKSGKFYAFSNSAGLLTIEKLDSVN
ncbi:similar to Saccharomyces cerevisiae YDR362C TFC6 One of six subunits of RNA polymerase III transcription initiation factor complex (TFIIIC) [Maudiozyma saulgeensis]|uniref:Similar to Saccharomyces cerevisiae YDR362C TFC6 One of six subunits of RNA polymerase III transcription initiation factor complex (TFIIIC) n=1 Tax=Maudiozyma saulgeensis TaxID=1789683 RepID=A0A1X7R2K4_9SACH|nr:similar to Saccharomyces cerevisiae YDR362C TFC6 One of six subunits of RNA polymerase III transcription initiation factor complex (TFIIIC) [Kazachstania saulgeensis]